MKYFEEFSLSQVKSTMVKKLKISQSLQYFINMFFKKFDWFIDKNFTVDDPYFLNCIADLNFNVTF